MMNLEEELKKIKKPIKNINLRYRESFSRLEKFAVWVTERVGSMGFFMAILVWTVLWLGWNVLAPTEWRFDSFPAFAVWLFISNMIQLFLLPLIMIGQNLQGRYDELRAESDYEINQKAELEIELIIEILKKQEIAIKKVLEILKDFDKVSKD
jgi:uncharacterized membrane protein